AEGGVPCRSKRVLDVEVVAGQPRIPIRAVVVAVARIERRLLVEQVADADLKFQARRPLRKPGTGIVAVAETPAGEDVVVELVRHLFAALVQDGGGAGCRAGIGDEIGPEVVRRPSRGETI